MANSINFVLVPCKLGPQLAITNQVDSAAFFRLRPALVSDSSGAPVPTEGQIYPRGQG